MTKQSEVADRLGDDILTGVPEIARYLGEKEWQTRWRIRRGFYDSAIFRTGVLIRGRKSLFKKLLSPEAAA